MHQREQIRYALARVGVLLIAGCCVWVLDNMPPEGPALRGALVVLAAGLVVNLVLPARWQKAPVHFAMLSADVAALAALGCVLVAGSIPGGDARVPFLSGFLVTTLVAVVGHRLGAAVLGTLGGTMVLAVGLALSVEASWTPQPVLLGAQVLLLGATAFLTAWIAGSQKREAQQSELAHLVDREIRHRESAAAELVTFTQALADGSTPGEIGEAVLRYLRAHTEVEVRAIALEADGTTTAIWEEAGRLRGEHLEPRRLRLQESLTRAGCHATIPRIVSHATGAGEPPVEPSYRTAVDLPVKIDGRISGVIFLGDAEAGALPPDRISVLVDVARRTGEAVRRLEKLRSSENRRTALLLRQMREGVLLLDADGGILLANPAARDALEACARRAGPDAPPLLGDMTLAELADTPPGVSRRFRAALGEDGDEAPMQLACSAICVLDQGRRIGTLVTIADVTEEELARGRMIQAEKMTLVGQTLAGVAHELNNPLAALIGYADLLQVQELPDHARKPVEQMREQAVRATRIVRNLLNFARRRNPERVPTAVEQLVDGTVELFAYEARLAGAELEVELGDDLPRVLVDKHAIQQILVNLVQNALHAMEDWHGTRSIKIRARADRASVALTVSDTGPGIPEELRGRIFESFFTTKGSTKGTGLGLALSRTIAQEHGGDLLLAPDTGSGASFTLRLPRHVKGRQAMTAPSGEASEQMAMPERVLVVDDEASVRETLVAQLGAMGARVDSASNATEALRMVRDSAYDALITDIRMPGGSGLDLHDDIADMNPFLADRIVFITGDFVNDDLLCRALDTGRLVLEKPFTMNELATALGKTVAQPLPAPGTDRLSA